MPTPNKYPLPESLVFILGCQRSGTTWLANIFDASPETLLFMEPFSPPYGMFPEFSETSVFLDAPNPDLDILLQTEMPKRLLHYKALLSSRSIADPAWFRLERWLAKKAGPWASGRLRDSIRKFELLNLNRFDTTYPLYPKRRKPSTWVIKELRFAGKIPVLLHAFPAAHFIVIVRHPCATVHSILNWFEKGRLMELRGDMEEYLDKVELQPIATPYQELIASCRKGTMAHKLALYWRISYETVFRQLEGSSLAQFLVYEQLASCPRETAMRVFEHIGIPWSLSLDEYMDYSTNAEMENPGPVNTRRESMTYYRSWMTKIPEAVRQEVLDVAGQSPLMALFELYYSA